MAKDVPSVADVSPLPGLKRDTDGESILKRVFKAPKGSAAKYSAQSEEYKADERRLTDLIHFHKATTSAWNQLEHILRPATDADGESAPEIQISDKDELRGALANLYKDVYMVQMMVQHQVSDHASSMTAKIMADSGVPKAKIPALTKELHAAARSHRDKTFLGSVEAMRAFEDRHQHRIDANSQQEILSALVNNKKGDFFASRPNNPRGRGGNSNRGRGAKTTNNDPGQGQC